MTVVTVRVDDKSGKVELWDLDGRKTLKQHAVVAAVGRDDVQRVGYPSPQTQRFVSYYIAMREGGFLWIRHRRVSDWVATKQSRSSLPTFDIWGGWYDEELTTGKDGEPYLLKRPRKKKAK